MNISYVIIRAYGENTYIYCIITEVYYIIIFKEIKYIHIYI